MGDDLSTFDDVLAELKGKAIRTTAGTFFREEDVRRLVENRQTARQIDAAETPKPKKVETARKMAADFLREQQGKLPAQEPGRSIPATAPQPPSRA